MVSLREEGFKVLTMAIQFEHFFLLRRQNGDCNREISLHVQRRIRVDVGHVFGVKTNPYLKIKYTFEIFHQPAVKL